VHLGLSRALFAALLLTANGVRAQLPARVASPDDALRAGFRDPPERSRPRVW
jgi:hypothetical protein